MSFKFDFNFSDHREDPKTGPESEVFVLKEGHLVSFQRIISPKAWADQNGYSLLGKVYFKKSGLGSLGDPEALVYVARFSSRGPESKLLMEHGQNRTGFEDSVLIYGTLLRKSILEGSEGPLPELVSALICKSPCLLLAILVDLVQTGRVALPPFFPRLAWLWAATECSSAPEGDLFDTIEEADRAFWKGSDKNPERKQSLDPYVLTESDCCFLMDSCLQMAQCAFSGLDRNGPSGGTYPLPWKKLNGRTKCLFLTLFYGRSPPAMAKYYALPCTVRELERIKTGVQTCLAWEQRIGYLQEKGQAGRDLWNRVLKRPYDDLPERESCYFDLFHPCWIDYHVACLILSRRSGQEQPEVPEGLASELDRKFSARETQLDQAGLEEACKAWLSSDPEVTKALADSSHSKALDLVRERALQGCLVDRKLALTQNSPKDLLEEYGLPRDLGVPELDYHDPVTAKCLECFVSQSLKVARALQVRPKGVSSGTKKRKALSEKGTTLLDQFPAFASSAKKALRAGLAYS